MDSSPGPFCPSTAGADWFDNYRRADQENRANPTGEPAQCDQPTAGEDGSSHIVEAKALVFRPPRMCPVVAVGIPTIGGEFFVPFLVLVMNHEHKE
jgi:hypothetical protein